jgi:hypothetical protein
VLPEAEAGASAKEEGDVIDAEFEWSTTKKKKPRSPAISTTRRSARGLRVSIRGPWQ